MPNTTFDRRMRPLDPIFDVKKRVGMIDIGNTFPNIYSCWEDLFDRANGALGNGWVQSGSGALSISSQQVLCSAGQSASAAIQSVNTLELGEQYSEMTYIADGGPGVGNAHFHMYLRKTTTNYTTGDHIEAYIDCDVGLVTFRRMLAGANVVIASGGAGALVAGDRLRFATDPFTASYYVNNVLRLTSPVASMPSGPYHGFRLDFSNDRLDAYEACSIAL